MVAEKQQKGKKRTRSYMAQSLLQLVLAAGIIMFINVLASAFWTQIDMTEDKLFSVTDATRAVLNDIDEPVFIEVYLDGDFPAGFERLKTSARDMLDELRNINPLVEYRFANPNDGTPEEINSAREKLINLGLNPTRLEVKEADGSSSEQYIFPGAIVSYKNRRMPVSLLDNEVAGGGNQEVILNRSVNLLEYKFANAIQKLKLTKKPAILYTTGHGELEPVQTADLDKELKKFYRVARVNLDSVVGIKTAAVSSANDLALDEAGLLIVAKPRGQFSEQDKFKIDQFVMNGGKVIWMIDRLAVDLDSLGGNRQMYVPFDYPLNLEDQLFRYGVKVNPNMVLDMSCTPIPIQVGMVGNAPQYDLKKWYYHVLAVSQSEHPIVKNLDAIEMKFPSSIDTFKTKTPIKKTVLLSSSENSRFQANTSRVSLEILRSDPSPDKFNKQFQPLAVLLEGTFPSHYKNRVSESMKRGLNQLGIQVKEKSANTRMIVISDGDIGRNGVRTSREGEFIPMPLGFNEFVEYQFGNRDFLLNSIEYLMDDSGVIAARNKDVKLRLLNRPKADSERTKWQLINMVIPPLLLISFGLIFTFIRRRRYLK